MEPHYPAGGRVTFFRAAALVAGDKHIKLVEHTSGVSEFAEVLSILGTRSDSHTTESRMDKDILCGDGNFRMAKEGL